MREEHEMINPQFNSLSLMQKLRNGGIDQKEAEIISEAITDAFSEALEDFDFATKSDLEITKLELKRDIEICRSDLKKDINEIHFKIAELEIRLKDYANTAMWKTIGIITTVITIGSITNHFWK